jgi:hypothetical protein
VLQGGNELCRIEGFDCRKAISELKVSIEAEAGLVPALTRLSNSESQVELQDHLTLEDMGMPSEHALASGVIQLYAQNLKKVVVADELQIAPGEVTDSELIVLCNSIRDDPPDILILCGCCCVTNISCLVQLSTISHLDISSCDLGTKGGFHLAGAIKDMGALTKLIFGGDKWHNGQKWVTPEPVTLEVGMAEADFSNKGLQVAGAIIVAAWITHKDNGALSSLNLANNGLGEMVLPEGWQRTGMTEWTHSDGSKAMADPSKPDGIIALANVISGMGALTKFNISENRLRAEGGKTLAAGLKGNMGITELNIARNFLGIKPNGDKDMSAVVALADIIKDMGAMAKFDISSNDIRVEGGKALAAGLKDNQVITELNISSNKLIYDSGGNCDTSGVIAIADAIPDMGALSQFMFSRDSQNSKPVTMETSMVEADFSGHLGVSGAIMLSAFLPKCT